MASRSQPKCKHCGAKFTPDCRNRRHQRYCGDAACRQASKTASQKRWAAKPENRDYFRGAEHVARVQRWRAAHPGYAKRASAKRPQEDSALQDVMDVQPIDTPRETPTLPAVALQDVLPAYPLVLLGLIAHLTGSVQQENIAQSARRLIGLANDILRQEPSDDTQSGALSGALAAFAATIQLDRSTPGP